MKVYLAAGFFSLEQEASRQCVIQELKRSEFDFYSPKEDGLYVPGETPPQDVFDENIRQIDACDFVVASTAGKDLGTLFECGYAYATGKPIVYFWHNGYGKFNLMLSQSGIAVATTPSHLRDILTEIKSTGKLEHTAFKGEIE